MNNFISISQKINGAKSLDFGDIFSSCIELFKKVWLQGLITIILKGVLAIPLVVVMYIPMITLGIISPGSFDKPSPDGLGVFAIIMTVLLFIIVLVFVAALELALMAAYYRIMKIKDLGLNQAEDYFFFLKRRYLGKTVNLGLMMAGIYLCALLMCVLPVFYVMIPLTYMTVVYAMNPDMPNSEIVKTGFALGNKKWLFTLGIVIVTWFLSVVVGFLMCVVGLYVTQQFVYLPFYHVYRDVVGFNEANAIEEIGAVT